MSIIKVKPEKVKAKKDEKDAADAEGRGAVKRVIKGASEADFITAVKWALSQ